MPKVKSAHKWFVLANEITSVVVDTVWGSRSDVNALVAQRNVWAGTTRVKVALETTDYARVQELRGW
jgi:IS1 family transposase